MASYYILIIVLALVLLVWLIGLYFEYRCPNCRRAWAVRCTGKQETKDWGSGDRIEYTTKHEYQCKYCGHAKWKDLTSC